MAAPSPRWPILQLVQYLAELSPDAARAGPVERAAIAQLGVERAVEALEADVGALVCGGVVEAHVGFGASPPAVSDVVAAAGGAGPLEVVGLGSCACVSAPLEGGAGHLLIARAEEPFDPDEHTLARALAGVLAISLRTADGLNLEREMRAESDRQAAEALVDPLTRLPNRALFLDRFEHALAASTRSRAEVAVLFMDVDRFKLVNDSLGHHAGDQLLVQLANRMRQVMRPVDTLARLGGDEFAVLIDAVDHVGVAKDVADRLLEAISPPVSLGNRVLQIGMSIGIASGFGAATTVDQLLRSADLAMYEAKAQRGGGHITFEPEMHRALVSRLELESDLALAVDAGELSLVYQPVVELRSGRVVGLEALVRWDHATRGRVPPADFIPVAEECGAIFGIGEWVLEQAASQMARWRSSHSGAADINVAVNLSARQLEQHDLAARIGSVLALTGLAATSLVLEITETSVPLDDTALVTARLEALCAMGTVIALDDFGTGHSSIAHLRSLPAAIVKVDRSFVAEVAHSAEHHALANGIISLSTALGLDTVAEGIETSEQLQLLLSMGCGYGQGYLFAAPLTAAQVDEAFATSNAGGWAYCIDRFSRIAS